MADYRSDFCHAWIVGGEIAGDELAAALGDLELAALGARAEAGEAPAADGRPPHALGPFLAGLDFLRTHLWASTEDGARAGVIGLGQVEGRVWAFRAGADAVLEQLTGAPTRVLWHPLGEGGLEWCELDAAEVWRLECGGPAGALAVHHRPALVPVVGALRDEAHVDSSSPDLEPPDGVVAAAAPRAKRAHFPSPAAAAKLPRAVTPSRTAMLSLLATAVLVVGALLWWKREAIAPMIVGRYDLVLVTNPAGATVRIDGEAVPGKTPLTLPLEPGEHRVELTYGEYANSVFTVEGERGGTVEKSVAWTGSLGVASADTAAKLTVSLDGRPLGALPLWLDDVPVGSRRLSFQGAGYRSWEEDAKVKAGQSTRIVAEPEKVPDFGLVTARAERVTATGVEDVDGALVHLDGKLVGETPVDLKLAPGPHSIRIVAGGTSGPVHHVDVQPGGRYYANTTYGRPAEPRVVVTAPAFISLGAPGALAVQLESGVPVPVRRIRLFQKARGAKEWTAHDLSVVSDAGRVRASVSWPTAGLTAGVPVATYVEVETREGEEYHSEIAEIPVRP